ncbi:MAG: aminotransferase class I/II-fold pyridoxal phosphate-dependent enzyme [Dehalococcoidia bacterium]|nr:aminotransferase class I/II-fold pyridoxal phosphate-dependent enzyme [Dehalococcoidia bacterium]
MPLSKVEKVLSQELSGLKEKGSLKGEETVITGVKQPQGDKGPRYFIQGYGDKEFLKMNSNSYLGMGLRKEVIEAEEEAAKEFGAGPGAVRFISGTYKPHVELERRLARFHNKEAGMIFSSAYAAVMGILSPLISKDTIVISDALNHNSIINAIRLSRPKDKKIYRHNNMDELESDIKESIGNCQRVIIVTDGIFSMRGDHAPLSEIADLAEKYDPEFEEGVLTIVDDSHGVGAIGETGRGATEFTHEDRIDILVSTMGKALGINGGYLVSDAKVIEYLRETAPFYIYSNPITVSEASATLKALEILDSATGRKLLKYLREMTAYFRKGLVDLGYEVIKGEHPVVPLMVRDTKKTIELVKYLKDNGILSTGLYYPVVPKGDEEIRFQICADHTKCDVDYVLEVLKKYNV